MASDWSGVALPAEWTLEVVAEIDSTNSEFKRREAPVHGSVLLAECQTSGRGRRGAEWVATPGESLTFSVALQPAAARTLWPRLALATGLAVAEAMSMLGLEAEVKWPNDVLIRGRKLCGVLVEATERMAIVGIGLNVRQTGFGGELDGVATSMQLEGRGDVPSEDVLGLVLAELNGWSQMIDSGFPDLIARLRERCALSGKTVSLRASDGVHQGRVLRIGDGGELLMDTEAGCQRFLQADEVRVVGED